MTEILMGNIVIIMMALFAVAVLGTVITYARNRHNVAPNQVAVISGRGTGTRGFRVVTGGGFFLWPILERIDYLFLNVMSFNVSVAEVPDSKGVLVDVTGVANVKIQSDEQNLPLAIERFLGKRPEEIQAVAKENLEANLRAIVGTMTVEELNNDRQKLQSRVLDEATTDLSKLGLKVDVLNIQQVTDKKGYISALGKARTAQVVRDANIGEANAQSEAAVAQARAKQSAAVEQARADQTISEAMREKELIVAENAALVQAKQARVPIIAQTAAADESKTLAVSEVAAQRARVEEETKLQQYVAQRNKAIQQATTLVTAQAQADATVITAEGKQRAATMEGEANRIRDEKTAQGRQALATAIRAEGEATAAANEAKLLAEARGIEARGLAEGRGIEAKLLAEGKGIEAKLLAEARGIDEKAKALSNLPESARLLMLVDASPAAIRALGDAVAKALEPAAKAIGEGLGNIDEVRVIDMGSGTNGNNALKNFSELPVEVMFSIFEKAKAAGMGPMIEQLAGRFGLLPPNGKQPDAPNEP